MMNNTTHLSQLDRSSMALMDEADTRVGRSFTLHYKHQTIEMRALYKKTPIQTISETGNISEVFEEYFLVQSKYHLDDVATQGEIHMPDPYSKRVTIYSVIGTHRGEGGRYKWVLKHEKRTRVRGPLRSERCHDDAYTQADQTSLLRSAR